MTQQPEPRPSNATPPPLTPGEMPPELQAVLKQMSRRGPVIDMATGATVAEDGLLLGDDDQAHPQKVACLECARAVALGWWGSTARHTTPEATQTCVLCLEGEAVLTAADWFAHAASLVAQRAASGTRRTWREDAVKGLGATSIS